MKLSILSLLSLASMVLGDSSQFGLMSIRSGSDLQYSGVYLNTSDKKFYVEAFSQAGNDELLQGYITDAGLLKLNDNSYVKVTSDGSLVDASDASDATKGFSIIESGHLAYNGKQEFYAEKNSDGKYVLKVGTPSSDGLGIALRTADQAAQPVPDFTPSGADSSSSTVSSTLSSSVSSATSSSSSHVVSEAENAANGITFNTGLLAVAAALLI